MLHALRMPVEAGTVKGREIALGIALAIAILLETRDSACTFMVRRHGATAKRIALAATLARDLGCVSSVAGSGLVPLQAAAGLLELEDVRGW